MTSRPSQHENTIGCLAVNAQSSRQLVGWARNQKALATQSRSNAGTRWSQRRPRLGRLCGTFNPSCRQIRSIRLWFTSQLARRSMAAILRFCPCFEGTVTPVYHLENSCFWGVVLGKRGRPNLVAPFVSFYPLPGFFHPFGQTLRYADAHT